MIKIDPSRKDKIIDMLGDLTQLIDRLDAPEMAPIPDRVPMQPIVMVEGVARFRGNAIVRYLIDNGSISLNHLARLPNMPQEDWAQFAQLLGYSVSGYGDLSYALNVEEADAAVAALIQRKETPE